MTLIIDIFNVIALIYGIGIFRNRISKERIIAIILGVACIFCVPDSIRFVEKNLFIQIYICLMILEGKIPQKIVWSIEIQLFIIILDMLTMNVLEITKFSNYMPEDGYVYIRGLMVLIISFCFFKNKKAGQILKKMSVKMSIYISISMVVAIFMMVLAQGQYLGYDIAKRKRIFVFTIWATGVLQLVLCFVIQYLKHIENKLRKSNKINEMSVQLLEESINEINNKNSNLRKFKHDYYEHIYILDKLIDRNNQKELKQYISELVKYKENTYYIKTGNIISDVIVNQMYERAKACDVKLEFMGRFPEEMKGVSKIGISSSLYNVLNNAIEAAKKTKEKEVFISAESDEKFTYLEVINSSDEPIIENGKLKTTKNDKNEHGFGVENIKGAMKECNGKVEWNYEKNKFKINLMIPNE